MDNKERWFTPAGKCRIPLVLAASGILVLAFAGAAPNPSVPRTSASSDDVERLPPPPANGEIGFVVEHFANTYEMGDDDCPDGLATMLRDNFIATLTPVERSRLLKPENSTEFTGRYTQFAQGPDNTDVCTNYDRFDHPPQKTVRGRIARGFDLDGDDTGVATSSNTCPHDNFTSPAGEAGVDNQVWRAMGCLAQFRGNDAKPPGTFQQFDMSLANGENAQVLLLRGVDSLVSDDDVDVIYANTRDRAVRGPKGEFITGASYIMKDTPGGPNVMKGRIVNGVLEASTPQLRLRHVWYLGRGISGEDIRGTRTKWELRSARLRLVFQSDGSVKGLLGGYENVADPIVAPHLGGIGAAVGANYDCAAMYKTLQLMADGNRDPKTGQCTTISTAIELRAIPAFVIPGEMDLSKRY